MKLKNIRRSVRIVRTENAFIVRTENALDRTNRTDRGKGLRIVNKDFQFVKESVCDQVADLKFVDQYLSYGPYELEMASRIVRSVRFVERVYES